MFNWLKKRKEERERREEEERRAEEERYSTLISSSKMAMKEMDEILERIRRYPEETREERVIRLSQDVERRRKEKERLWKEVMGESNTNSEKMKNGLTVETSEESGERIYRIF